MYYSSETCTHTYTETYTLFRATIKNSQILSVNASSVICILIVSEILRKIVRNVIVFSSQFINF